jgi:hypothetical protein
VLPEDLTIAALTLLGCTPDPALWTHTKLILVASADFSHRKCLLSAARPLPKNPSLLHL